jgi:hypothetical protein
MGNEERYKPKKGEATAEQIAGWKAQYKDVYAIEVEDSVAYLHKPDRIAIKAMSAVATSDPIRASEILLENCWLGGDPSIKTEDEKFLAVSGKMGELIEIKSAELKKL